MTVRAGFGRSAAAALFALGLASLLPGAASAGPVPYTSTLSVFFGTLPPIVITGGGVADLNGSSPAHVNSIGLNAGDLATTALSAPVTDPAVFPIAGLLVTAANGAGSFGPLLASVPSGGGVMPLLGTAKVCLFASCGGAPAANLTVPLSVIGAGGSVVVTGLVNLTVIGAPWTIGTATAGTLTVMGFAHGPASLTSSTGLESGVVRLVTPVFISTNLGGVPVIPVLGVLDLHFIPEPGTALLLGAGVLALAAGRRRLR